MTLKPLHIYYVKDGEFFLMPPPKPYSVVQTDKNGEIIKPKLIGSEFPFSEDEIKALR